MNLGERIKAARRHAKLTQAQLGKAVGVSQQMIQKIEAGNADGTAALLEICIETGVSPKWLARNSGPMLLTPIQIANESNSRTASLSARLDPLKLQIGFGMVDNFFKAEGAEFVAGDDLDLLALAYEWTLTRDGALLGQIGAEIKRRVEQRGGSSSGDAKQGEVDRARARASEG